MASIGHLAAGALLGAFYARTTGSKPLPAMAGFAALALAPDLDLFTMGLVEAETALDHRVATHAFPTAAMVGCFAALAIGKRPSRLLTAVVVFLTLASHGLLDGMTRLGPGTVLWWPFDSVRRAFAWQPIPGAASFQEYFGWGGIPLIMQETLILLPIMGATALLLWVRPRPAPKRLVEATELPAPGD